MNRLGPRRMPSMSTIVEYWRDAAPEVFPNIIAAEEGWEDPFCFRCGWFPPSPDNFDGDRWQIANGWLERAHLVARSAGGPDEPFNLVPPCPLCHHVMPPFSEGIDPALDWIRRGQPRACPALFQALSGATWRRRGLFEYPGRQALFAVFHAAALAAAAPDVLGRAA